MKNNTLLFTLIILLLLPSASLRAQEEEITLTIFAAASLTDVFEELAEQFETQNPGVEVVFNFGSSSDLAAQLAEGAPADIFASANAQQMQVAVDAERIAGEPVIFAGNRLALVVPADNFAEIESLHDLANEGVLIAFAAEGVPIRDYTEAMLDKLAEAPDYGEDYREAVLANVVTEEENVRQVVAKIVLGEVDAGIVYLSDVTPEIAEDVLIFEIPDEVNTLATYPIVVTNDSEHSEQAQAFIDFMLSEAGQEILASWNFVLLEMIEPEPTPEPTETVDD